jgi:hypothetical protein
LSDPDHNIRRTVSWFAAAAGLMAALIGLVVRNVVSTATWRSAGVAVPVIIGIALMAVGLVSNRDVIRRRMKDRRVRIFLTVWAGILLAFLLLVLVNAISARTPQTAGWSLDLTASRVNTLSHQTLGIIGALDRDVKITVFRGLGSVRVGTKPLPIAEDAEDLVRRYAARSGRIEAEIIDIYRNNTRARQAGLEMKIEPEQDSLVVTSGGRNVVVPFADLVEAPAEPFAEPVRPAFLGEDRITSAILSVTEEEQPVVYFLSGHGEMGLRGGETEGLSQFATELRQANYRVDSLDLFAAKSIPADAALLIVAGPRAPFRDEEVQALRSWLNAGGRMLLFALPLAAGGNLKGLDALLDEFNVAVRPGEVAIEVYPDVATGQEIGNLEVILQRYGNHPITRGLATVNAIIRDVSPVRPARPETMPLPGRAIPVRTSPYTVTPLLLTTERAWGETDLTASPIRLDPAKDTGGPLSLAVAVAPRPPQTAVAPVPAAKSGPRLVVIGSTTIAFDGYLRQYMGNRTFLMNAVNWLAEHETRIGIPPRRGDRRELAATPSAIRTVFFISVIAMPLTALACGIAIWFLRRR